MDYSRAFLLPGLPGQDQLGLMFGYDFFPTSHLPSLTGVLLPPSPRPILSYSCLGCGMFDLMSLWTPSP